MKQRRADIEKELKRLITKAHILLCKMKDQKDSYEREKHSISADISKWMDEIGESEFSFEIDSSVSGIYADGKEILNCKKIEPKTVKYNAEAIYKKMGKKNAGAIISKSYSVNDMQGLIELLKGYGVDPKKFKRFITVSYSLDEKRLEQLYELGVIKKSDLEGCYKVEKKKPYWSIRSVKKQ